MQAARHALVGLPESLQACFRTVVADQYRALADLFITQGHNAEARWVLDQLKDFEAYQYNRSDPEMAGAAFDPLPLRPGEAQVIARIHGLPLAELSRLKARRERLLGAEATEARPGVGGARRQPGPRPGGAER